MRTLLLVDDNGSVLATLAFVFEGHGYRTLAASSGEKALEIAECETIDAALVDLHMPGIDGVTACQRLGEMGARQGHPLPTWLMSGALTMAAENYAKESGVIGVFKKPFDTDVFLQAVEKFYSDQNQTPIRSPDSAKAVS